MIYGILDLLFCNKSNIDMNWWHILVAVIFFSVVGVSGKWWYQQELKKDDSFLNPKLSEELPEPTPLPLSKYRFDELVRRTYVGSEIVIEKEKEVDNEKIGSYVFSFESDGDRITGVMNVPKKLKRQNEKVKIGSEKNDNFVFLEEQLYPVIIMVRGYVDKEIYESGMGTEHMAEKLAEEGYVTLAPDFLGFGGSDDVSVDVWEDRFRRPVDVLNLIYSIGSLTFVDSEKVGIWGHSNGGQVALSVLEISGGDIPTVLWAPMSKPFPYGVLYYTDEFDDEGKYLRGEIAQLERDYDVRDFSITDYLGLIKAPIQLHQGTGDDAVPYKWSQELVDKLEAEDVEVEYFEYSGADHNLVGSWEKAASRSVVFFDDKLD